MSEPEKHHFVPVFYLRNWCGENGRLFTYSKPHDRVVVTPRGPDYTGFEDGLYSLQHIPTDDRQALEKLLAKLVDSPASTALDVLVNSGIEDLTSQQRVAWTVFLMSLRVRGPDAIRRLVESVQAGFTMGLDSEDPELLSEYQRLRSSDDPTAPSEWVKTHMPGRIEDGGLMMLPNIIGNSRIAEPLAAASWKLIDCANSNVNLLTSDRPLRLRGDLQGDFVIYLPLSPRTAFVASNRHDKLAQFTIPTANDLTRQLNLETVQNCVKRVYGTGPGHLKFISRHFPEEPVPQFRMREYGQDGGDMKAS